MTIRFLPQVRVAVLLALTLNACNSLGYYSQSVAGQWELLQKRQSIGDLLKDPNTPTQLKTKLREVQEIREFASRDLALPDNDSYRSYADLGRPYVVWNVFAAPPLQTKLQTWCFPVAGCVSYRGYFTETAAQDYAGNLRDQGLETYVGGVAAYSTLGWFDDPLLNTVIKRSEPQLAGLIFHELAHQVVYVKGDTAFNEAFATAVELEGVQRWLAQRQDLQLSHAYAQFQLRQQAFVTLVTQTRNRLQNLYSESRADSEKLALKQTIIAEMRAEYARLKTQWQGYSGYDAWFEGDINNARLAAVTTYRDQVPAFQILLASKAGDFAAFYSACKHLADLPMAERQAALQRLQSEQLADNHLLLGKP